MSFYILYTIIKQSVILCCYTNTDKQVTTSRTAIQECTILFKWQFNVSRSAKIISLLYWFLTS